MFKNCLDYAEQMILNMRNKKWNNFYIHCAKRQKIEIS